MRTIHQGQFPRSGFFGLGLFLAALIGQAFTGHADFNAQQITHGLPEISLGPLPHLRGLGRRRGRELAERVPPVPLYIFAHRLAAATGLAGVQGARQGRLERDKDQGSARTPSRTRPRWAKVGGWRTRRLLQLAGARDGHDLRGVVAGAVGSPGWAAFNETRLQSCRTRSTWGAYLRNADFWARTLQNWQSEFLAVGRMAVSAIYLRQRGSSQSKPVGEPHAFTGVEG